MRRMSIVVLILLFANLQQSLPMHFTGMHSFFYSTAILLHLLVLVVAGFCLHS